jgi:hypothetical protein
MLTSYDVTRVGDVGTDPGLVGLEVVGTDESAVSLCPHYQRHRFDPYVLKGRAGKWWLLRKTLSACHNVGEYQEEIVNLGGADRADFDRLAVPACYTGYLVKPVHQGTPLFRVRGRTFGRNCSGRLAYITGARPTSTPRLPK